MFNIDKYREIKDFLNKTSKNTKIIAISKNHPKESVNEALNAGVRIFGENRVLEAKKKFTEIKSQYPEIELHLTGPLQSNKVKEAISIFDVFHTLDREKIAKEFNKSVEKITNKQFFIQVNTGEEKTKSGVSPKETDDFINFCKSEMGLNVIGLMCIPPINDHPRNHFELLEKLSHKNNLSKLSIGMSNDYQEAIKFKPSYIRLGTVLFGKRN